MGRAIRSFRLINYWLAKPLPFAFDAASNVNVVFADHAGKAELAPHGSA
jgi:hypothetical protein